MKRAVAEVLRPRTTWQRVAIAAVCTGARLAPGWPDIFDRPGDDIQVGISGR